MSFDFLLSLWDWKLRGISPMAQRQPLGKCIAREYQGIPAKKEDQENFNNFSYIRESLKQKLMASVHLKDRKTKNLLQKAKNNFTR